MKKFLALCLCLTLLLPSLALADLWNCSACGKRNMDSLQFCLYCGMPQPVATATPRPVVTATPQPVVTATPRPVVTAAPQYPARGDTVYFGHFDQDYDYNDGGDPIEWIVLDVDGTDVLLISKYILHSCSINGDLTSYSWVNSGLRYWLNNDFYNQAFSRREQSFIQFVYLPDSTGDSVYILSADEAERYLPTDASRACSYSPRAYWSEGTWWLRTPGRSDSDCAQMVKSNGYISRSGFNAYSSSCGVRPVIVVDASCFN